MSVFFRTSALRPQLDYVGLPNSGQTTNCTRLSLGFVVHF